ncbi:MAG: Gfo/Idh/MocA family oxidoreductase [Terracidiphilus sp.]
MIRVGVVGFGLGGRVFHAALVSSVEGLELAAIVERSGDKAALRYPGVTIYRSLEDLLKDGSIDLVVITTPSGNHFEAACQSLEAGKNVVVDKPMAASSAEIAELMRVAAERKLLLAPFHNRRWDGDFRTVEKVLREGHLGRLVDFESYFDRWRPVPKAGSWKEDPVLGGGLLLDIGTHLADQAMVLFGKPQAVSADVTRERDGEGANDSFTVRLRFEGFSVILGSNCLASPGRPRFLLRGTKGNYWKWGLDPQEAALSKVARIPDGPWGEEAPANWGSLNVDVDGGMVTCPVTPIPGDYRLYYAGVRDAILGETAVPVSALDAWRTARLLERAEQSAKGRCEIECDWSEEPA